MAPPRQPVRIKINRAPVLTLWAAVVAERLGFEWQEALSLGRAVAGLNAYSKGKALGLFHPKPSEVKMKRDELGHGDALTVNLLHRAVPVVQTRDGLRAVSKDRPIPPESVERYLQTKFGNDYGAAKGAMTRLAKAIPPAALAERAYALYEAFRPDVPAGTAGWGATGVLNLGRVLELAK